MFSDKEQEEKERHILSGLELINAISEMKTKERDKIEGKHKKRGKGYTRSSKDQSKKKRKMQQRSRKINRKKK